MRACESFAILATLVNVPLAICQCIYHVDSLRVPVNVSLSMRSEHLGMYIYVYVCAWIYAHS